MTGKGTTILDLKFRENRYSLNKSPVKRENNNPNKVVGEEGEVGGEEGEEGEVGGGEGGEVGGEEGEEGEVGGGEGGEVGGEGGEATKAEPKKKQYKLEKQQAKTDLYDDNTEEYTNGKKDYKGLAFIFFLSILIIVVSSSGYYTKKHCLENKKIYINSRMVEFFMGFGTGLMIYTLCVLVSGNTAISAILIIVGLFLSIIGSVFISSYDKMKPDCIEDTTGPELSMGLLGSGIGIITFSILYGLLTRSTKSSDLKYRILALVISIILIIIPSVNINMINKCDKYETDTDMHRIGTEKTVQGIALGIGVLLFLGICISFKVRPPK
jgi:hypothetical protein